jgi:hypothetical protein
MVMSTSYSIISLLAYGHFPGAAGYWDVYERWGIGVSSPSALLLVGRYHRDTISELDCKLIGLICFSTLLVRRDDWLSISELDGQLISFISFGTLLI